MVNGEQQDFYERNEYLNPSEYKLRVLRHSIGFLAERIKVGVKESINNLKKNEKDTVIEPSGEQAALVAWYFYIENLIQQENISDTQAEHLVYLTSCILDFCSDEMIDPFRAGRFHDLLLNSKYGREHSDRLMGFFGYTFGLAYTQVLPRVDVNALIKSYELKKDSEIIVFNSLEQFTRYFKDPVQPKNEKKCIILSEEVSFGDYFVFRCDLNEENFQRTLKNHEFIFNVNLSDNYSALYILQSTPRMGGRLSLSEPSPAELYQEITDLTSNNPPSPITKTEALQAYFEAKAQVEDPISEVSKAEVDLLVEKTFGADWLQSLQEFSSQQGNNGYKDIYFFLEQLIQYEGFEHWRQQVFFKQDLLFRRLQHLSPEARTEYFASWQKQLTEYYQQLFVLYKQVPFSPVPEVLLTRSGTSANSFAINLVNQVFDTSQGSLGYFKQEGWYYENKFPDEWQSTAPHNAQVFFCCIHSTQPDPVNNETHVEQYQHSLWNNIALFNNKAWSRPNEIHFLVVDKTTDIFNQDYTPRDLAPNIILIETTSLTKHANGLQSRFFGSVAIWNIDYFCHEFQCNRDNAYQLMNTVLAQATGTLTPEGIMSFPEINYVETNEFLQHHSHLSDLFQATLLQAPIEVRKNLPIIQKHNYFLFCAKPTAAPNLYTGPIPKNGLPGQYKYFEFIKLHMQRAIKNLPPLLAKNFTLGDSFGLDTVRIADVPDNKQNKHLRISFGRRTTPEAVTAFAQQFIACIQESLDKRTFHEF